MRVLSWNWQRLGNYLSISYLRELLKKHRPEFVFLSKTKQDFIFMQKFQLHLGNNNKLVTIDLYGTSSDLALFFNAVFKVNVLFKNNRVIDIEAEIKEKIVFF